jgi:hypothetical protein
MTLATLLPLVLLLPAVLPAERVQYCILFGVGDQEPARWDGSLEASGARILDVSGWRLSRDDSVSGSSWQLKTRRIALTRGMTDLDLYPALESGVYVLADTIQADPLFRIRTAQGTATFRASEVEFGNPAHVLDGRVTIERIPVMTVLTNSAEEQDLPAVAKFGDTVYMTYVEFTHGARDLKWGRQLRIEPDSFDALSRPAGGDRIWLREYSIADRQWSEPQAVGAGGQDIYAAAVAVDGLGRVWVIRSKLVDGNFDIYASFRDQGRWSAEVRVTRHPGPDISPEAVTDSDGAVWITWQGYREDLDVLVARQAGDGFSAERRVSTSGESDWAPQIAAARSKGVAISWDTYDNGNYDVYARQMSHGDGIEMQTSVAVAASARFEARSSVAFDSQDRLWVAYEESFPGWGKDFGAYETTGAGLYQDTTVQVRVLQGGRLFQPEAAVAGVFDALPASSPNNRRRRGWQEILHRPQPDPSLATERPAHATPYPRSKIAREGYPRLAADDSGNVFLAFRTSGGDIWGPLGTCWFEHVARFDGEAWEGPTYLGRSDGLLDQRPALTATGSGKLLIIGTTDHRFTDADLRNTNRNDFNFDLVSHAYETKAGIGDHELEAVAGQGPSIAIGEIEAELEQVTLMRGYRAQIGGDSLQLMRGEFHRHTEISGDGGRDGSMLDAWRYFIDASYLDWAGCCDHDNGYREYPWWRTQKLSDAFHLADRFVTLFSYERSVRYPEGHRNLLFAQRGVRPLPRLPRTAEDSPSEPAPDTQMLYRYLRRYSGLAAVHTSGTRMGTDWRDNDPDLEPWVEIYQGDRQNYEIPGGPRTNTDDDSIGGWRPLGFVSNALAKGYRLGFQASSDHLSTHMSYANVWVTEPTREAMLDGIRKRRVYGATDNILADVRSHGHFMGEEFETSEVPRIEISLNGTADFQRVAIIKDGRYVHSADPRSRQVKLTWTDSTAQRGETSFYYVRGEQVDDEIVWVSPMWITYR